jgi:hypothetical protein
MTKAGRFLIVTYPRLAALPAWRADCGSRIRGICHLLNRGDRRAYLSSRKPWMVTDSVATGGRRAPRTSDSRRCLIADCGWQIPRPGAKHSGVERVETEVARGGTDLRGGLEAAEVQGGRPESQGQGCCAEEVVGGAFAGRDEAEGGVACGAIEHRHAGRSGPPAKSLEQASRAGAIIKNCLHP